MSSTYLTLVNRVLQAFNEVPLTASTWSSAVGFHQEVKDAVQQAIYDVFTFEDTEWPFARTSTIFDTTVGDQTYNKSATFTSIDWGSFKILRPSATTFNLSQTGGVATFVAQEPHYFVTGDTVVISGATQEAYNGSKVITVVDTVTFTYTIDSSTASPADYTSGLVAKSETVSQQRLRLKDIDSYRDEAYDDSDAAVNAGSYSKPFFIVRKQDNNFIVSPPPDRIYQIFYEGFYIEDALATYNTASNIPTAMDQVIVDKALHYAYMFRDNLEQAALAHSRYEDNVRKWRRILIPQYESLRSIAR